MNNDLEYMNDHFNDWKYLDVTFEGDTYSYYNRVARPMLCVVVFKKGDRIRDLQKAFESSYTDPALKRMALASPMTPSETNLISYDLNAAPAVADELKKILQDLTKEKPGIRGKALAKLATNQISRAVFNDLAKNSK